MNSIILALSLMFPSVQAAETPAAIQPKGPQLEFPTPPEPARIKWLQTIRSLNDLRGRKKGFLSKLMDSFVGGDSTAPLFERPYGVWVDSKGRIFMPDNGAGVVHILDLGAQTHKRFSGEGKGTLAMPAGAVTDPAGNLYVSDAGDNSVKAFGPNLKFLWKLESWEGDGAFGRPAGMAWSPKGELLVIDAGRRSVAAVSPEGRFLREFLQGGKEAGALGMTANLWVEKDGTIIESDPVVGRVHLFSPEGKMISGFGESGDRPGYMARPRGVATDSDGNIYVVDAVFNRVQIFNRQGQLLLYFAAPGDRDAELNLPAGLFIDSSDKLYLVDAGNSRLQVFQYIKVPASVYEK